MSRLFEFQRQYLSRVLKRYMKTDAKQMVGVRRMHEKMEATLALGYATRRLEKDVSGDDKQLLTECVSNLEKDPFKKARANARQAGQKVLGTNPEIKKSQPSHDVAAFERNSSPESGSSDTDLVPRSTFRALEVERDMALQTAEQERQEKLKEQQEKLKEQQEKLKERQEKQEAIRRADELQRQLDELLGTRIAGKKRTGAEMEGSEEK